MPTPTALSTRANTPKRTALAAEASEILGGQTTAANLPIGANAILEGTGTNATARLYWWDLAGRAADGVVVERRVGYGGVFEPITQTDSSGWVGLADSNFFSQRSAQDSGSLHADQNYTYRIGVDLYASGHLDEGEYVETSPIGKTS